MAGLLGRGATGAGHPQLFPEPRVKVGLELRQAWAGEGLHRSERRAVDRSAAPVRGVGGGGGGDGWRRLPIHPLAVRSWGLEQGAGAGFERG